MSTVDYILSPLFEAIMVAVKIDDGISVTHVGDKNIRKALAQIDWASAALLCHNTRFDGSILAWHYGHVPALYLDTLSMSRATTHWTLGKSSLKAVSDYLGLPPKGDEVVMARGKGLENFSPYELEQYRRYCERDNDNCKEIFDKMRGIFSASELRVIDLVLRMFIQPQVKLDADMLEAHLDEVQAEKALVLAEVEATVDKSVFSSNLKFAALLESYGVSVPMKPSPTGNGEIPALAKNDRAFKELQQDASQPLGVQALLAARVSSKSTIEETRTRALLSMANKTWPLAGTGWGAVPLKYSGARTHRLSGDDGTNWQNFKRGSKIRQAIRAPHGFRIVHRDASQIEARMVAWLAQCHHLIKAFAEGRDVYSEFASLIYGRKVTKADAKERFIGKTGILSLGYSASPARFREMLFIGSGGVSVNVEMPIAQNIVYLYRDTYAEIPELWNVGEILLSYVAASKMRSRREIRTWELYNSLNLPVEPGHECIWLPSGLAISYPGLHATRTARGTEMVYDDIYSKGVHKIYGAKAIENISQALSRIVITDAMVRMHQLTGYYPFLSTHDSLDYVVPISEAEAIDDELEKQFAIVPSWGAGLPLASEGGWGVTLHDAEQKVNQ